MSSEFGGTERFTVKRRLGAGGMGVVYEAWDHERGAAVALKTLRHVDAGAIYRFKQEFRALADATHRNLVALHELVSAGEQWFFTMELVAGVDFLAYVRDQPESQLEMESTHSAATIWSEATVPGVETSVGPLVQFERLRSALRQLAEGVVALHKARKLHRDIKPSNVLVTPDGRVVLLDFGLVADLATGEAVATDQNVVGTVAYMAPEQGASLPVSEASDWYSVGVMLYEALTGRLPFVGPHLEVLMNKQRFEPAPPRQLVPGIPEDLDALCVELLRRRPDARPSGAVIMRRLGSRASVITATLTTHSSRRGSQVLVGRERHLQALRDAFEATRQGRGVTVRVHGSSGMGKSALVQEFLDPIEEKQAAVILSGRCYERESVPYKALDSVIDALTRYLLRLSEKEAAALMPRDTLALARLFPVLMRVTAIAEAPRRVQVPDPRELRMRAFAALRELLARLIDRTPLIVCIDDVQWGDVDSAELLNALLQPPDPPPFLLLVCYRSEDVEGSPFLQTLWQSSPAEVAVGPLSRDEARDFALALLNEDPPRARQRAENIARESAGNPFFVDALVQHLKETEDRDALPSGPAPEISLNEVLRTRLVRLPVEARRLLEVVAVAGRPLEQATALRAAGIGPEDPSPLAVLKVGHLVRSRGVREAAQVEAYHDRIRETTVAALTETELQDCHNRLAMALQVSESADAEELAVHFRGAGLTVRAGEYASVAADQAAQALAFDRAARLYRIAIELQPESTHQSLQFRLGEALANAGRGAEAAQAYLAAVAGTTAAEQMELQRRAAEQLLRCGHIDEGLAALRSVLAAAELPGLATTPGRALASLLLRRGYLRLRGLRFRQRDRSQVPATDLTRIDICWSVALGLSTVDTIRGADFQARNLLLSLRAGEPYLVARSLALEAAFSATSGVGNRRRTSRLLHIAAAAARESSHPHALGMVALCGGTAAYLEGHWSSGVDLCRQAERILRDGCTGVAWEVHTADVFALACLAQLGKMDELGKRTQLSLGEALGRGDVYAATNLRTGPMINIHWLAADDLASARRDVEEATRQWSQQGFHIQHLYALLALGHIDLYAGDPDAAHRRITQDWPALKRSLLLRFQLIRILTGDQRARFCLARAAASPASERKDLLRQARRDAGQLEREGVGYGDALAQLLRAGIAAAEGNPEHAVAWLARATSSFDTVEMALHAAAARRRHGELLGGDEGRALVAAAGEWEQAQKIRNPERMTALMAPGFGRTLVH